MSILFRMSRRARMLVRFAPISDKRRVDRPMRSAIRRAQHSSKFAKQFENQQAFDKAIAGLVEATPVSDEVSEWFRNEKLIPTSRRSLRGIIFNPAFLAVGLAGLVIAAFITYHVLEQMREFPGSGTARKLLIVARETKPTQLEPTRATAGSLGDLFFLKYQLEHYDVPPEFANMRAGGERVFDDDEGHRVAQIYVPDKHLQFFLFPAALNAKATKPEEFEGWRFVEQEGWSGAVQVKNGVAFMAALRGDKRALAPFLNVDKSPAAASSPSR